MEDTRLLGTAGGPDSQTHSKQFFMVHGREVMVVNMSTELYTVHTLQYTDGSQEPQDEHLMAACGPQPPVAHHRYRY